MAERKICAVENCGKPVMCKGWCNKHYYRLRPGPRCAAEGCELPAVIRGHCNKHSKRMARHGDPLGGNASPGAALAWLRRHATYTGCGCLRWPFARSGRGYGYVRLNGVDVPAHREMCRQAHGEPPSPDHVAAHSCGMGHEACVHPDHLRWATHAENSMDAVRHGTHGGLKLKGERHPGAKLTDVQAREIRHRALAGEGVCELAREFGVCSSVVSNIKSGRSWSHLSIAHILSA